MNDKEKVIDALKACAREDVTVSCSDAGCPYWDDDNCTGKMARDALDLLKAQEPLKPFRGNSGWACSACGNLFRYPQEYCDVCGRQVNWDA